MPSPARRRCLGVAAAVLLALGGTALASTSAPASIEGFATAAAPAERAVVPDPPTRALLISDSAWLGMRLHGTFDAVQGTDVTLALASCRRRVATSCTNFDESVPITLLAELDAHPTGYDTLIVATGYNDDDGAFVDEIDTIITRARSYGYDRVVWLTLRSNVLYVSPDDAGFAEVFERSNTTLRQIAASGRYPELVVADWAAYAIAEPRWFAVDGIHLGRTGGYAAADYLSRKLAFLDGLPCPQPLEPGGTPADPCLDPDAHGPIVDVRGLYPTDQLSPERDFILIWEGTSSWPAPPWWER